MNSNIDFSFIRISAIAGSLRKDSFTKKAALIALDAAKQMGAQIKLIDLSEYNLPFCDGRNKNDYPDNVKLFRKELQISHGIILASPEYHASFSGVLKNALDLCGFSEFEGKIVGLIGVSGGTGGLANSMNALRVVGRALHSWVLPMEVSIPESSKAFDFHGTLIDKKLEERLIELGKTIVKFCHLHFSDSAISFLNQWQNAQPNPGGQ